MPRKSGRRRPDKAVKRKVSRPSYRGIERTALTWTAKAIFVVVLLIAVYAGLGAEAMFIAAFFSIFVFLWGTIVLPADRLKNLGVYLATGEAGEDTQEWLDKNVPWRKGGGR